ncbi:MAG: hypothetical protein ACD_58C00267G0002 [uncultured bacterium]|nr:MAG: hypothetical protein ACD_58C00267G0002 [uncultured bacterium]
MKATKVQSTLKEIIDFVLYPSKNIRREIKKAARQIVNDYRSRGIHYVIAVVIMNGASFVATQLLLEIGRICFKLEYELKVIFDTMTISSYGENSESSGEYLLKKDMHNAPRGKEILFIEDIIDTGGQYQYLMDLFSLENRRPANIRFFSMINKNSRRVHKVKIDYCCFLLNDDYYVAGFGLDYRYGYRNHPDIFVVKKEWQ